MMMGWQPIETAPKDGTRILGRRTYADRYTGRLRYERRQTYWGKTSHVPLYGWNWGRDPENQSLWQPTHWQPLPTDNPEAGKPVARYPVIIGVDAASPDGDKSMLVEARMLAGGRIEIISIGQVIEGDLANPSPGREEHRDG